MPPWAAMLWARRGESWMQKMHWHFYIRYLEGGFQKVPVLHEYIVRKEGCKKVLGLTVRHPMEVQGYRHEELVLADQVLSLVAEERSCTDGVLIGHDSP